MYLTFWHDCLDIIDTFLLIYFKKELRKMQQYDMAWLVKQIVLDKGGNTNSVINSISCIDIVYV